MSLRAAMRRHGPVRRFEAGELLESFLICAVAAVLLTRAMLKLAGWPQLGGDDLHIAHLLWGGLLMLAALVVLFSSLTRLPLHVASVIGGIGFGLFLDELGKYVTADNDYFWRPAASFIYICFILLYLIARAVARRMEPGPEASLVNALELAKEAVLGDLDPGEKARALDLLDRCEPDDPLVPALRQHFLGQATVPAALPAPWSGFRRAVGRTFDRWIQAREFAIGFAVFAGLAMLAAVFESIGNLRQMGPSADLAAIAQSVSSLVASGLVGVGLVRLRGSRSAGWRFFRLAAILSILLVQSLAFSREIRVATIGLVVSLLIWVVAGIAERRERRKSR
jgi:hypothetical protein